MTEPQPAERPEWLDGWQPKPRGGNPAWTPGCASPNPKGRPPGSPQTKLMQRMLENADGIVDAIVAKALEGDTGAAGLIMARLLPSLRAQSEKVAFPFDASASVAVQVEMVLNAIASGAVAPDIGKQIIEAIQSLSAIRATEDLEARIITLEQRQV